MRAPRVLVDASNLRAGGGVQVAGSFLDELARFSDDASLVSRYPWIETVDVEATPEVIANLAPDTAQRLGVVETNRGRLDRHAWTTKPTHDVAFTVFGPLYGRRRGRHEIVGMADVTSIYSVPETRAGHSVVKRRLTTLRRVASRALFSRADEIIVEATHVRTQLQRQWHYPQSKVHVVPNCVNALFKTRPIASPQERHGWIFVTRAYPHKNIGLLGRIGEELHARGVRDVRFLLTLNPAEWNALDTTTRRHCDNLGSKHVEELPAVYAACEGSVFPSLLECFSAAPLEALFCGLPLVASDRDFVKDVCGDAALYADPRDPAAWADAILAIRRDPALRERLAEKGREVIDHASDARTRALAYVDVIDRSMHCAARL